jgi:uracil-DNA glycosylase
MDLEFEASWKTALSHTIDQPYFKQLVERVNLAYNSTDVWPKKENIFKAFEFCPISEIKVVILGQDPYPTPGHAHGLCFSIPETVRPLAKSLQNIFKEIRSDLKIDTPAHGNLDRWAKQGVFLLNTVLTVEAHIPNSHKKYGWESFTEEVIKTISAAQNGVVFLLWGAQAQQKAKLIDGSKHHILTAPHPSPLSAYRGFFGCKHFSKTNELLALQNKTTINW